LNDIEELITGETGVLLILPLEVGNGAEDEGAGNGYPGNERCEEVLLVNEAPVRGAVDPVPAGVDGTELEGVGVGVIPVPVPGTLVALPDGYG